MGSLKHFDLKHFRCDIFFETGTGGGRSLAYAYDSGVFLKLYSVEIHQETAKIAGEKFHSFKNITIINSDSISTFRDYLPEVSAKERILFFLDAHFPGEFFSEFKGYDNV